MSERTDQLSTQTAPQAPAKVDPESLALRVQPGRAIRFKRSAIVAIAGVGSISLAATTWIALRPDGLRLVGLANDQSVAPKSTPDAVTALPASYGDVPQLGPPLPGDLGRPILEQQRAMAREDGGEGQIRSDQAEVSARDRRIAALRAARESGLLFQNSAGVTARAVAAETGEGAPAAILAPPMAIDPQRDPNSQQRKVNFVGTLDSAAAASASRLRTAESPYILSAGSVIAASLITGLRSDLPGLVTAQVTEQVFDSITGKVLLVPQGARLLGIYDSVVAFGQRRALLVWQRLIMPDGSSIQLDNLPATDPSGFAGLEDKVDFHTWALLKGVAVSTMLGAGANLSFSGESDLVQVIRESTQQNVSRAGDQITSRNLQIQPTITIRPGAPVRLLVHRDLILAPWPR
ncbi:TrbI/VirB10 family protein [soil metagenome]